ncbi:DUF3187 family protein [Granulosicoccaceae sp. 1_MG-2023]|nr:DUF3187 family protein [Granulosicoccaceae sp. 1_MG-2023]
MLFSLVNTYLPRQSDTETLLLDGETGRADLAWSSRINARWRWGAETAVFTHGGGILDSFVDHWHETFDLPASGRYSAPTGRLLYWYQRDGQDVVHLDSATGGVGDIQVWIARRWLSQPALTTRIGLALPSGSSRHLTGKGSRDLYADISYTRQGLLQNKASVQLSLGVVRQGHSDLFPDLRKQVFFSQGSIDYRLAARWSAQFHYLLHSAVFNSSLRVLGEHALMLYGGAAWQMSEGSELYFGVSEDPEYGTAQDVGLHLGYRRQFR